MHLTQTTDRPAHDWNPWDIKACLGKKGYTLTRVALESGYSRSAPGEAFRRQWPAMERIIADVIGVEPWEIWPSRYDENKQPYRLHAACHAP